MEQRLPFPITVRPWDVLAEDELSFAFADEYLPLHPNHSAQFGLLLPADAARLRVWAGVSIHRGWPDLTEQRYAFEETLSVSDCWNDAERRAAVRRWLYQRGIPFRRTVYLLYDERVVQTTWRMVVKYWDALAWSVGYAMYAIDHTQQWACCFHHEDCIVFGSHEDVSCKRP